MGEIREDDQCADHEFGCSGEHWAEDTFGREVRIECGCDCPQCAEY